MCRLAVLLFVGLFHGPVQAKSLTRQSRRETNADALSPDTQASLLQGAAAAGSADGLCPEDASGEALSFWKDYFESQCSVDWEDLEKTLKEDVGASAAFPRTATDAADTAAGCLIVTPLSGVVGGTIVFDVLPPSGSAPSDGGWSPQWETAKHQLEEDAAVKESPACGILSDGLPRLVKIPPSRVEEVFQQLKADYKLVCKSGSASDGLALATDTGEAPIVSKKSMSDDSGNPLYTFALSVSPATMDPVEVEITVEEDGNDATSEEAATFEFEEKIKEKAEFRDRHRTGKGVHGKSHDESDEADEIKIEKLKATLNAQGNSSNPVVGGPAFMGKLRLLDEQTTPHLCCLCGRCTDPKICTEGEDADEDIISPAALQDNQVEQLPEQEDVREEVLVGKLLTVGTASWGSAEESQPPSRLNQKPKRARVRAAPGYGDNFHSLIMPSRTAVDHKRVWAQSRALIESARAEGLRIPQSYHFYDSDETGDRCYRHARSQGKCGSCYSFASLGALEKQICQRSRGSVHKLLSREMLIRCSEQNFGCEGGNADKAYEDLMDIGGVFDEECVPYQGQGTKHCPAFAYSWFGQGAKGKTGKMARIDQELQKSCKDLTRYTNRPPEGNEWDMPFRMMYEARFGTMPDINDTKLSLFKRNFAKTRSRDRIPSWWLYGEQAMKTALVKYGSIYASFKVRKDFGHKICDDGCHTPGTVYGEENQFKEATCGCPEGHAVHIIGYGEDVQETGTKVPYWLVENSWGQVDGNGAPVHGDLLGNDVFGGGDWGLDPFTEDHPTTEGIEEQCVLAGWLESAIPMVGGCLPVPNVRHAVPKKCGDRNCVPDGFVFSAHIDGKPVGDWKVATGSFVKFSKTVSLTPGRHKIMLQMNAKDHPLQQGDELEQYNLIASHLRCRGRGYRYSFGVNDTKAQLSWGRKTRKQLAKEADALVPGDHAEYKFGKCPAPCRTGSYSTVKPCLGIVSKWGSCYTSSWALKSTYIKSLARAECLECKDTKVQVAQKAYAVKHLDPETFKKWFALTEEAWTAPDEPGWMRKGHSSCKIETKGFVTNAALSATYDIEMPDRKTCDERNSVSWYYDKLKIWNKEKHKINRFVNAPGAMADGETKSTRCPQPMLGSILVQCRGGALYHLNNTCQTRFESGLGFFKILRGKNYHGIEEGGAFAIAEMARFESHCPTFGWSRWSECNSGAACVRGMQHRSRSTIELDPHDPRCAGISFYEERPCVGAGYCPQVLTRMGDIHTPELEDFMKRYASESTNMTSQGLAKAGSHIFESSQPSCNETKYWCHIVTGKQACGMLMEGHFEVKKAGAYRLSYKIPEGKGVLEFNEYGKGHEKVEQYKISSDGGMYEWQDLGFHHRRRRSNLKPWQRVSSLDLPDGTYYVRMTLTSWTKCPEYTLQLEEQRIGFNAPMLFGITVGAEGEGKQPMTPWNNDWGAIDGWVVGRRGREGGDKVQDRTTWKNWGGYGPRRESGFANEVVFREEKGIYNLKFSDVNKSNFTADELYALLGTTRAEFAGKYKRNHLRGYEFVLRQTVILPTAGRYDFKFRMDTSFYQKNVDYEQESRRRYSKFAIRVGGPGGTITTLSAQQGVGEKDLSWEATEAGTVPFEASMMLSYNGIVTDAVVLPESISLLVKKAGGGVSIGSDIIGMSEIDVIRGDNLVRIDWPDRADPLSSELKTHTFMPLEPHRLLIGKTGLKGFEATIEGRIDAGACLSLEAWVPNRKSSISTWGVALNLCDVDGSNQYLELSTYHAPTNSLTNFSQVRVGWTHIAFVHPTHLRITRDPMDLTKFDFSFRPDNRELFATPFLTQSIPGFEGDMEVGVSMTSAEAYRYAEFYNISINDCPSTCEAAGSQAYCGTVFSCGRVLNCSAECSNGEHCKDNMCLKCPPIPDAYKHWECGELSQTCTNHFNKQVTYKRFYSSKERPSAADRCIENKWKCDGDSKWAFLDQGKTCGKVTDKCGKEVELFGCPLPNDACVEGNNTCLCSPKEFAEDLDCGWSMDGCGKNYTFGEANCSSAGERALCHENKCCLPKSKADFPGSSSHQCGTESDGCGGIVQWASHKASPFATRTWGWGDMRDQNTFLGQYGFEFEVKSDVIVTSLGRGRGMKFGSKTHFYKLDAGKEVFLWDCQTRTLVTSAIVGPSSEQEDTDGYAWESLEVPVKLKAGKKYRIVRKVRPYQDRMCMRKKTFSTTDYQSDKITMVDTIHSKAANGYPSGTVKPGAQGWSAVNFGISENDGCGPGSACKDYKCSRSLLQKVSRNEPSGTNTVTVDYKGDVSRLMRHT